MESIYIFCVFGAIMVSTFETINYHFLYYQFLPFVSFVLLFFMLSTIYRNKNKILQMYNLFFFYILINIIFSSSLKIHITTASLIPICILNSKIDNKVWDKFMKLFGLFALFAAISLLIQFLVPSIWENIVSKIYSSDQLNYILYRAKIEKYGSGIFYDPSILAGILVFWFCCYVGMNDMCSCKDYVISAIILVLIFLTGKRGQFFSLISAIILYVIIQLKRCVMRKSLYKIILSFLSILFLVTLGLTFFKFKVDFSNFRISFMQEGKMSTLDNLNGRSLLWLTALTAFFNNPLVGIGWKNFAVFYGSGNHVHNIYLQLITETGVIGFVLFIVATIITLTSSIKILRRNNNLSKKEKGYLRMAFIYQIFFLVYGMSGNPLFDSFYFFPYMISARVVITEIYDEKKAIL